MNKTTTLAQNPGLEAALKTNHRIVRDIAERFEQYGTLSPKQIALVFKIASDTLSERSRVTVPTGRFTVRATVLSVKERENAYSGRLERKMTVKVTVDADEADGGEWLAWGSVPSDSWGVCAGETITLTAAFEKGSEHGFGFFKRPKVVRVVEVMAAEGERLSDEYHADAARDAEMEREARIQDLHSDAYSF